MTIGRNHQPRTSPPPRTEPPQRPHTNKRSPQTTQQDPRPPNTRTPPRAENRHPSAPNTAPPFRTPPAADPGNAATVRGRDTHSSPKRRVQEHDHASTTLNDPQPARRRPGSEWPWRPGRAARAAVRARSACASGAAGALDELRVADGGADRVEAPVAVAADVDERDGVLSPRRRSPATPPRTRACRHPRARRSARRRAGRPPAPRRPRRGGDACGPGRPPAALPGSAPC